MVDAAKATHWINDYGDAVDYWHPTREAADHSHRRYREALQRVAVIRREQVEGQEPEYFRETV